ncbi:MAG: hypothetical protein H7A46_19565 [Verrucomicrobiales bacterium]|nr:hypothetical protein [Verrucomicrobiales bacterium]
MTRVGGGSPPRRAPHSLGKLVCILRETAPGSGSIAHQRKTCSPQQIAGAQLFETPYGFQREEHTHFQLLVARGDTVTGRVHSWNEVAPDSYEFYRSTRTFCLMANRSGSSRPSCSV